jgi:hypothetical protein
MGGADRCIIVEYACLAKEIFLRALWKPGTPSKPFIHISFYSIFIVVLVEPVDKWIML